MKTTNMSKFYRPNKPILKLQVAERHHSSDESSSPELEDNDDEDNETANKQPDGVLVNRRMPPANHLLFVALLEHLCSVYETDPVKSERLFHAICRQLSKLKMMNPLTVIDELSTIKAQYKKGFFGLLRGALAEVNQGSPALSLRDRAAILLQPRPSGPQQPHLSIADVLGFHTSRYREDFVELGMLGRGAYGSVFQVKNKLDSSTYAVKKIIFKDTKPEVWYKILREVKHLAALAHPHIVRYYAAWLEQESLAVSPAVLPNTPTFEGSSVDNDYSLSHGGGIRAITYQHRDGESEDSADSDGVLFDSHVSPEASREHSCARMSPQGADDSQSIVFDDGSRASHITVLESGQSLPVHPTRLNMRPPLNMFRVVMYIQMELCVSTLTEWINSRNKSILTAKGDMKSIDSAERLRILRQVFKAVDYIHSQNLIHRDLKPKNIFVSYSQSGQLQAKIGDFGLSRSLSNSPPVSPEDKMTSSQSPMTSSQRPMTPHPGVPSTPLNDEDMFEWDMYTSGVGTTIYAAPEQLHGSMYNQKSDVYSLGLITFELHQAFGTAMERVHCLSEARRGALPDSFTQHWPVHSMFITKMLSEDPEARPTMAELLKSELFKSKDEIIKDLKSELTTERTKVSELTDTVNAQRLEIARLRQELSDLRQNSVRFPFAAS